MVWVPRPRIWTAQPQSPPRLASSGIAQRLIYWTSLHPGARWGITDLVSRREMGPNAVGGSSMVAGQRLQDFAGGTNFVFALPAKLQSGRPFAVTWLQKPGTQTNAYPILFSIGLSGADHFAAFQSPSDSSYGFVIGRLGSTAISFASAVGLMTSGTVDRYLVTSSGGPLSGTASDWVLWRNGERLTAGGNIATFADSGSGGKIGSKLDNTYPYTGQLGDFGLFDGVPSPGEIKEFFRNPHGSIYAPRRGFVFVASGGGITGAVAAGTTATAGSAIAGTQTHVGVSAPGTSATAGSAPAGTQTHQGAVAAGASATAGSTPAGTSAYAGAVAAGASATAGSAPAGTQVHAGVVAAAVSATVGSAPAGTQVHVGAVAAGVSATLGSTVAGGGDVYSGTVAAGASATLGSAPAGTQTHVGTVAAGASATVGASPTGTQVHQGVVAAGVSVTVGSTVAGGGSVYSGAVAAGATATAGSAPAGTQSHVGVVSTSIIATLGSAPAGTQIYVGAVAAGVSATVGGTLGAGGTASAAEVWAYELSPGVSAQQYVLEIHAMLTALSALAPCPTADAIASAVWSRELPL